MKDKIYLKYKGRDSWDRPVYQDESGKLWKDVEPYSDRPAHLCSACDNAFDGELHVFRCRKILCLQFYITSSEAFPFSKDFFLFLIKKFIKITEKHCSKHIAKSMVLCILENFLPMA